MIEDAPWQLIKRRDIDEYGIEYFIKIIMSEFFQINPGQTLPQILLQSPLRSEETLKDVSFIKAQQNVIQDVLTMYKSNFYEWIKIHYGVKEQIGLYNYQDLYKGKEEILNYKIDEEKMYIERLKYAQNEEEMDSIENQYQSNLQTIQQREETLNTNKFHFIPKIYIEAKKKMPFYGKIVQEFDKKGWAMLRATLGYRSPFLFFDKIEFNMQSPSLNNIQKRSFYQFGLNWTNPLQFEKKNFYVGAQSSYQPIFRNVDERKQGFQIGYVDPVSKYELQFSKRLPNLYENFVSFAKKDYFEPSTKISLKVNKTLEDTIERGEIETGKMSEIKGQLTVPFISQSNFLKVQYNRRQLFDLYSFGLKFSNQKMKQFFRFSNLQSNFNFQFLYSRKSYVSDLLQNPQIRGFDNDRNPHQSMLSLKSSIKFNVFNYPAIGRVGLVPFLYVHGGLVLTRNLKEDAFMMGSSGMGVSYMIAKSINLELLYPFSQHQNRKYRQPSTLQFRISIND